jgi:acyl carrier protein
VIKPTVEEIRQIVEISLDRELESFSMDANFYETYAMDSLGAVAMVVEVQRRYDVRIPDDQMPNVRTGNQLKELLEAFPEIVKKKEVIV